MSWNSLLHNPEGITAVYGGDPPDLSGVRLRELTLHEDGPTLTVRLDLPAYPNQPPRKWAAQGFNTVQIELSLSGLRSIELEGFASEVTADVFLSEGDGIAVDITSPHTRVQAVADTVYMAKLTAYTDESRP
ncbi:immunity 50 family protein [Streptomyces sp. LP11]|uniref:Immunity 50 family protein n=1 Tax=Streptomyces pyxinicus TaxID=2970331 RepID=A0ABT2AYD5_9ACTN|nr:immunity 50 family protein [Streptomyces sp. LP11]MCS0601264.1 immunity 50 family protein [Streptomyces sp. LP11]